MHDTILTVLGATSASSKQPYVGVHQGTACAWLPRSAFALAPKELLLLLASRGISVIGKKACDLLYERVKDLDTFPLAHIFDAPGWQENGFALPDGTIFSPKQPSGSVAEYHIAFQTYPETCTPLGDLKTWRKKVAIPMNGHALGVLALSLAFTAPLMRFMPRVPGFMFELVGANGTGKSALVQLMASTIGDPRLYQTSLSASVTDMAEMMARHNDLPLVLDEAERLMASGDLKGLRQAYLTLAYPPTNHASGMPDSARGLAGLGLLAISASLRTPVKSASSNDDLITLNVPSSTRVSVFPEIPERYSDGAAFIDKLLRAAAANHGNAYRHFLAQLVEEAHQNPTELAKRLEGWQNSFMNKANIAADDGAGFKLARVFAGIYAAGRQAREYGAIPKCAKRSTFLLECFALANRTNTAPLPFRERLEALRRSDRVLTITRPHEDPVQMKAATEALGTIKVTATCQELRISPHRILEAFPDWQQLERSDEVKAFLVMDGRNLKAKAKLAPGLPNERLYRFKLPVASESLFDDAREAGS